MSLRFVTQQDMGEYVSAGSPFAKLLPNDPPAKQMIAWKLYGDLIETEGRSILDVGCGHSPLVREFLGRHTYTPCDSIYGSDWRSPDIAPHSIVIANDLFPNVDQGLADFLARWYGKAELRMSLTVYENRYYRAKRVDGDEILTVRAWDWRLTREVLEWFGILSEYHAVPVPKESLFPNGRQVALLRC